MPQRAKYSNVSQQQPVRCYQVDSNGKRVNIQEFKSQTEATKLMKINNISRSIKTHTKSGGYLWEKLPKQQAVKPQPKRKIIESNVYQSVTTQLLEHYNSICAVKADNLENKEVISSIKVDITHNYPCIYGYHDELTDKWYVGLTVKLSRRAKEHLYAKDNNPFHVAIKERPDDFKLVVLERPVQMFHSCDDLCKFLGQRERYWIEEKQSYVNGYNYTTGGQASVGSSYAFARIKKTMERFELHKRGAQWYVKHVGMLGDIHRDYIICAENEDFHGVKLGQVVHKWRNNPRAVYFLIENNLSFLINECGFTWNHDREAVVQNLHSKRDAYFASRFNDVGIKAFVWAFEEFGHVNVDQAYVIPETEDIQPCLRGFKLGVLLYSIRAGRAYITDVHRSLLGKLHFKSSSSDWQMFLLQQGLKEYRDRFAATMQKGVKVPQRFRFPADYHVKYLQNYMLGANMHNLMRRRVLQGSKESVRWQQNKWWIICELVLINTKRRQ